MWRRYCSDICNSFTVASSAWASWKATKHIKCLLSGIRLMTGFFWAGCHQFQIEPEVLIKLSLAGFFFILTAELQTQAGLLLTNLSTFFCGAVSYHPMAQGRETLPGSCFFLHQLLPAVCSESIARGAGVLSPCRCTSNLLAVLRIYVSSCLCG